MTTFTAWAGDTAVRAVKTAAQTLAGMLGAGAIDLLHVDWRVDLAVSAGAAVACVLQNVQSMPTPWQDTSVPEAAVPQGDMAQPDAPAAAPDILGKA